MGRLNINLAAHRFRTEGNVKLIHGPLGEAIREWVAKSIKEQQPSLCFEIEHVGSREAVGVLLEGFASWETGAYILIVSVDNKTNSFLVAGSELEECLREVLYSENTVTMVDPYSGGGCTVDWIRVGVDDYEMLLVAWGFHESIVPLLKDRMPSGHVFRGN